MSTRRTVPAVVAPAPPHYLAVALAIVLAAFLGLSLSACAGTRAPLPADPQLASLSPEARKALSPEGNQLVPVTHILEAQRAGVDIVFLDARPSLDYDFGHIPGALNVPYFEADRHADALDKDRLYVAYCECPHAEAVQLADALIAQGFRRVKVIDEGLYGWTQAGGAMAEGAPSSGSAVAGTPGAETAVAGTPPAATPGDATASEGTPMPATPVAVPTGG